MENKTEKRRPCAYLGCPNMCQSRGKKVGYFRWCQSHRKGAGKQDRLKLNDEKASD